MFGCFSDSVSSGHASSQLHAAREAERQVAGVGEGGAREAGEEVADAGEGDAREAEEVLVSIPPTHQLLPAYFSLPKRAKSPVWKDYRLDSRSPRHPGLREYAYCLRCAQVGVVRWVRMCGSGQQSFARASDSL